MDKKKAMQCSLLVHVKDYIAQRVQEFDRIPAGRKEELKKLAGHISKKLDGAGLCKLTFICTHNSRRSHMAELWAGAAACYFGTGGIYTYSGGTGATAFNPRAVKALRGAGFTITQKAPGSNPVYASRYKEAGAPVLSFSKKYTHPDNPQSGFTAVMVCSHADENCPYVPGAEARFALPYHDPKEADGQANEAEVYAERCREIAREMCFLFSCLCK